MSILPFYLVLTYHSCGPERPLWPAILLSSVASADWFCESAVLNGDPWPKSVLLPDPMPASSILSELTVCLRSNGLARRVLATEADPATGRPELFQEFLRAALIVQRMYEFKVSVGGGMGFTQGCVAGFICWKSAAGRASQPRSWMGRTTVCCAILTRLNIPANCAGFSEPLIHFQAGLVPLSPHPQNCHTLELCNPGFHAGSTHQRILPPPGI